MTTFCNLSIEAISLFATASFVGINTSDPKSVLQLNNGTSNPLSLNIYNDSAGIGYNWYYDTFGGDSRFDLSKQATKLEMSNLTGLTFKYKPVNLFLPWVRLFEVANPSGFNYLRNTQGGNFISGSVSINSSATTTEYSPFQLMFVNGSLRTNSALYEKITFIN